MSNLPSASKVPSMESWREALFWEKVVPEPNTGCWLWLAGASSTGYGGFNVGGRMEGTHRVSWTLSRGRIPEGMQVLHRCDVRPCVNPDHLFLGSIAENMHDKKRKGRQAKGETNGKVSLSVGQVLEARRLHASGEESMAGIGRRFDVNHSTIERIVKRITWKHV